MLRGDCLAVLADMEDSSVDSIVTDPPYEIGFMGRAWDATGIAYDPATWAACLRVLKPGGHLLSFGATRTYHGIASAIERAGFEIRDCLSWLYGSGFPKSLDVSKAIDKAAGAEREPDTYTGANFKNEVYGQGMGGGITLARAAAVTDDARRWDGWGTALKPAWEPIVLARKPLVGTVAANVLRHGTGALNVDGCRVATTDTYSYPNGAGGSSFSIGAGNDGTRTEVAESNPLGRWPANVTLDAEAAAMLDEQGGERRSAGEYVKGSRGFDPQTGKRGVAAFGVDGLTSATYADRGGASRFFYVAKPSTAERSAGLDGFEGAFAPTMGNGIGGKEHDPETATPKRNVHPTVKPIELMRWLCRLVTPPGGVVLDPFTGSGTTGCAAVLEGFDFVGCEMAEEYADIAEARIAWWAKHAGEGTVHELLDAGRERDETEGTGQVSIFDLGGAA